MPVENAENKETNFSERPPETENKVIFKLTRIMPVLKKTFQNRKIIMILIAFGLALTFLFLINSRRKKPAEEFFQPDQPLPSGQEQSGSPSAYASDSLILEIEKNLAEIKKELLKTELSENQLLPPELDMNVSF